MRNVNAKPARFFGPDGPLRDALLAELRRCGYDTDLAENPALVVVIVAAARDEEALATMAALACPVVAVIAESDERMQTAKAVALAGARGLLELPLRKGALAAQIGLATTAVGHQRRLENKVLLLERTLKSRRQIEKATLVIATVRGITQTDAYELLRSTAMSKRITMAEAAQSYIAGVEAAETVSREI
jgi:AmiR/NasT family two-component response regulator